MSVGRDNLTSLERTLLRIAGRLERAADFWNDAAEAADEEPGRRYSKDARGAERDARSMRAWVAEMRRQRRST